MGSNPEGADGVKKSVRWTLFSRMVWGLQPEQAVRKAYGRAPFDLHIGIFEAIGDMATNTEYILRMVLKLIDKCESLEEPRSTIEEVLKAQK